MMAPPEKEGEMEEGELPKKARKIVKAALGTGSSRVVEVDAADVVRLMLQFLQEQGLERSAALLREESGVAVTGVEDVRRLSSEAKAGKWESVLRALAATEAPLEVCVEVHEAAAYELVFLKELEVAKAFLRKSEAISRWLRQNDVERWRKLEFALASGRCPYDEATLAKRRSEIATMITEQVHQVASSRLETLVGDSLKWRQHVGDLSFIGDADPSLGGDGSSSSRVDLFLGDDYEKSGGDKRKRRKKKSSLWASRPAGLLRFGKGCRPTAAIFSAAGDALITGSSDGLVEIWDWQVCRLKKDLVYQAQDELLVHDDAIVSLAQSADGSRLASSDASGVLKVWNLNKGTCLRKWKLPAAATGLVFGKDNLAAAFGDGQIQILGLASGARLATFRGHDASVTSLFYLQDLLVSASADGSIRLWDTKTNGCLKILKPASHFPNWQSNASLQLVAPVTHGDLLVLPAHGGPVAGIINTKTDRAKLSFDARASQHMATLDDDPNAIAKGGPPLIADDTKATAFVNATLGSGFLYCLSDDGRLFVFRPGTNNNGGETPLGPTAVVDVASKQGDTSAMAIAHHPHRSLLATYGSDDALRLWKA